MTCLVASITSIKQFSCPFLYPKFKALAALFQNHYFPFPDSVMIQITLLEQKQIWLRRNLDEIQRFYLAIQHLQQLQKTPDFSPFFPDFIFIFHTFSRSGKLSLQIFIRLQESQTLYEPCIDHFGIQYHYLTKQRGRGNKGNRAKDELS